MDEGIKTSQRVSRSCVECGRRKIKCDKKSPCQPCIRRNVAHECRRPITRVRGQLTVGVVATVSELGENDYDNPHLAELMRERGALHARIAQLETALALSKPCAHSHVSSTIDSTQPSTALEDIVPAFEQFDLGLKHDENPTTTDMSEKDTIDCLYDPSTDPILLLLPSREASDQFVRFTLQTLGWLHCAVDISLFLKEHDVFWDKIQLGVGIDRGDRPWLAVYLALLAVGILYCSTEDLPTVAHLPQLGQPSDDLVQVTVHTSRLWYEASLKEIERHGFSGTASLPVVQALAILTLCHSNFGEHQREWLFTGFATNMARCLDMHKLGSETACSKELCSRHEWSTPAQRELGRRLWWTCVIRDWSVTGHITNLYRWLTQPVRLGVWSRPPSISPASFCCQLETQVRLDSNVATPTPFHYHSIMSRLAYIFYIYIKANTHHTRPKFAKAIEEIRAVKESLPLYMSPMFPATIDDEDWERENPWVPFQRYLITHVLEFMQLSIARILATKELGDDAGKYRALAVESAKAILYSYSTLVPRFYRLVWTVSASAAASAIYVSLDMIAYPHEYQGETKNNMIELLRQTSQEMKNHAAVAMHAAKGSMIIESVLPFLRQEHTTISSPPQSLPDILRQLSASTQSPGYSLSTSPSPYAENALLDTDMLLGDSSFLNATLGPDHWETFIDSF